MTVSSIVQDLLEKRHITTSEAMVLLKAVVNSSCCNFQNCLCKSTAPPHTYPNTPGTWYTSTANHDGTYRSDHDKTLNDNFTSK
jgi:hypothetical protein